MGHKYFMHWESQNIAMFVLSIILLLWLRGAVTRFLRSFKYRAASLAGNVAIVRGIGSYPSIFDTATPDHLMALRQRRAPAAVVEVPVVLVPVSVELAAAALDSRAGIYLRLQSSVPCMMTALGGLNEERLKKVLPLLSDVTTRSETSLPEDNRAILNFFRSCELASSCGTTVLIPGPIDREVTIPRDLPPRTPGQCVLIVPGKPPRSPSVLGSIDFAIFLVGAEGDSSGLRLSATSFHGAAEGGDVEIGAIGGPEPDQAARLPGPGSVLVAAGGSLYTSMEMFGTVEDPEPSAMSGDCSSANAAPLSADECVICLTDPKEVLLIPCRHLSVCRSCFQHVDKCPVCRSTYDQYLTVQRSEEKKKTVTVVKFDSPPIASEEGTNVRKRK